MRYQIIVLSVIVLALLSACAAQETAVSESAAPTIAATATAVPPTAAPPTDTPVPPTATPQLGDAARGQVIFENGGANEAFDTSQTCAHCHSLDGSEEGHQRHAPALQGIALAAGERVPDLSAADYLRQSIMETDAYVVEGYRPMSRIFGKLLSEQEVDDLVAFLLTLEEAPAAAGE